MKIVAGGSIAIQYSETNTCEYCKQDFRLKDDTVAQRKRKHCTRRCQKLAYNERTKEKRQNTESEWTCKTCGSLVSGNILAKNRSYCTSKCYDLFSKHLLNYYGRITPSGWYPKYKVELIKEGDRLKAWDYDSKLTRWVIKK